MVASRNLIGISARVLTKLSGLFKLYADRIHHVHLNAGVSLPTGSIDEEDEVLAPTGTRPTLTLPYPMQIGSGTYDLLPGLTYTGHYERMGWGAQYAGILRLNQNDEDYTLGDQHSLTAPSLGSTLLGKVGGGAAIA